VVENRPGAGGNIGTEYVTKQPADGYTVLVTTNTHVTNVSFFKKLPYEPLKDFEAVSLVATVPFVMAVNASSPLKSAKDLIELARTKPGTVTYASGGIGTPHHLAAELFRTMAGIEMTHIPYKGSAPAAAALVANEVITSISAVNSLLPYVRAGKLRALAVAAANRTSIMPDVPTIAEAVPLPGYAIDIWYGVLVPAATPRVIVERLNGEINRAVRDPQVNKERLNPVGLDGVGTTPERFLEVMQADIPRYLRIARDANISPE
jgi:tripartite-type tricarboxylate transporter receptor subunit TctC